MKKIIVFLSILILLNSCNLNNYQKYSKKSIVSGFNTFIELTAYTKNQEEFNYYYHIMMEEFNHYHRLFDIYNNYNNINNIKTINDYAGKDKIFVEQEIIDLLMFSKFINNNIDDNFNITAGSILKEYHNYRNQGKELNNQNKLGKIPDYQKLNQLKKHIGFDKLIINNSEKSIFITDKKTSLDVGGIAKGYAVEKIAIKLKKLGLKYGVINAGGNIKIIGLKPNNKKWNIGVQNPKSQIETLINFFPKTNQSIVTSGNYQNFYIDENNQIIHHIIDLKNLKPANHFESVTVIVNDGGLADALSTTFYILNYQQGKILLNKLQKQGIEVGLIYISKNKLNDNSIKKNDFYITYNDNITKLLIK